MGRPLAAWCDSWCASGGTVVGSKLFLGAKTSCRGVWTEGLGRGLLFALTKAGRGCGLGAPAVRACGVGRAWRRFVRCIVALVWSVGMLLALAVSVMFSSTGMACIGSPPSSRLTRTLPSKMPTSVGKAETKKLMVLPACVCVCVCACVCVCMRWRYVCMCVRMCETEKMIYIVCTLAWS